MARWLTFDKTTSSRLRARLPREQVFEHGAEDAVAYAAGTLGTIITVLPTDSSSDAVIAVFRHLRSNRPGPLPPPILIPKPEPVPPPIRSAPQPRAQNAPGQQSLISRAGGVLGIRDELVFEEEEDGDSKKSWWRRFWDD